MMYCNQPCCSNNEQSSAQSPMSQSPSNYSFCLCSNRVLCFIAVLFALTLGIVLGASIAIFATVLDALIILAVVLFILVIAILIAQFCRCCYRSRC
ncbi:MAG: hypothetical protein R2876_00930 [Eubacteriales bacterium]